MHPSQLRHGHEHRLGPSDFLSLQLVPEQSDTGRKQQTHLDNTAVERPPPGSAPRLPQLLASPCFPAFPSILQTTSYPFNEFLFPLFNWPLGFCCLHLKNPEQQLQCPLFSSRQMVVDTLVGDTSPFPAFTGTRLAVMFLQCDPDPGNG